MPYSIGNSYYIDGLSLYNYFGVGVEDGSNDLLKPPDRKDSISHDWTDENGIDIDLSRVFLQSREATFQMFILADNEADFWNKYNAFVSYLQKPGTRRLTISEFNKDFYVFYKSCKTFARFTRIKEVNKVACKFTLVLVEKDPSASEAPTFLITEDSRFIIT